MLLALASSGWHDCGNLNRENDMKTYISQLKDHIDGQVTVSGWLYNSRASGKLQFLIVRDGTGNLRFLDSLAVPRNYVVLSSAHEPGVGSLPAEPGPEFLLLPEGLDREKIDATLLPLTAHLADPLRRVQAILTWLRKDYVRYEEDQRVVGPEAVLQKAVLQEVVVVLQNPMPLLELLN